MRIDIDLDDIYDDMSHYDKEKMAEWLEEEGFCILEYEEDEDDEDEFEIKNPNLLDEMWVKDIKKLFHGRLQLSLEDEETIKQIANKL
jgi:ribosomal protein L11 methylase PrmA